MAAPTSSPVTTPAEAVHALCGFLARHRQVLVLTGAGISTGSGIPDYRDAQGQWKRPQPVNYQDFIGQHAIRQRYWARSLVGWPRFACARPNAAHHALAALQRRGLVGSVLTQNVDGLHQQAGSPGVIDLHGRLDQVVCLGCAGYTPRAALQERLLASNPGWDRHAAGIAPDGDADLEGVDFSTFQVPACEACGGMLKPDVVFYGESVPAPRVARAFARLEASGALLVVGSSLMVWSGLRFARRAAGLGLPVASLNLGLTRADDLLSLRLQADCVQTLADVRDAVIQPQA